MKRLICTLLIAVATAAQAAGLTTGNNSLAWGDQADGTYLNPVINADFSDPDVIRVGEKYYMVASDFHFLGMQVLEGSLACCSPHVRLSGMQ